MNKKVKTIAWICLVLGLMGVAVDAGVYVRGRMRVSEMQETIASGEMPARGGRFGEAENDTNRGGPADKERNSNFDGKGNRLGGFVSGGRGLSPAPLFLLAAGPVLTVVGAVMLLVNREPKQNKTEKTKNNTKKATKSTKETKTKS